MVTILVVDYDESTRRVFKHILVKRGFSVHEAKDGEEAIRKMKTIRYDAVLLSFELPDMHGIDLLFFLKKSVPNALKIITAGFSSLDRGIQAVEAGADAYFAKPVDPEKLILVIEEELREERNKLPTHYN